MPLAYKLLVGAVDPIFSKNLKGGENAQLNTRSAPKENLLLRLTQKLKRKEKKMNNTISRFLKEDDGVTMIEYGLIAAVIAIGVLATLQGVRDGLKTLFNKVVGALTT